MKDINLALISGVPIPIEECHILLRQPTIKDISYNYLDEADFFIGAQYVTIDKQAIARAQGKVVIDNSTNFDIFMTIMKEKEATEIKTQVKKFLKFLFPDYDVLITPMSLVFRQEDKTFTVDKDNFTPLQEIIKKVFCLKERDDQPVYNPANKKAEEIANKLKKGRERIAKIKGEDGSNIFSQYLSSLSIGLHLPIHAFLDYTVYQLFDAVERMSLYTNWDIDIRSRLAGAQNEDKPENWMRDIHKN